MQDLINNFDFFEITVSPFENILYSQFLVDFLFNGEFVYLFANLFILAFIFSLISLVPIVIMLFFKWLFWDWIAFYLHKVF